MRAMAHDQHVVDVILRDGTTLRLHPPQAVEAHAVFLLDFFSRPVAGEPVFPLSRVPQCSRRPSSRPSSSRTARDAPSARSRSPAVRRIVAVAGWIRLRDPRTAEAAFAVEDAMQGRGVGTRLLEQLALSAAAARRRELRGRGARREPRDAGGLRGRRLRRPHAVGRREYRRGSFPASSRSESYRAHVDRRDHVAVVASLRPFFSPAKPGRSRCLRATRARSEARLFRNVVGAGFAGAAYPVNRSGDAQWRASSAVRVLSLSSPGRCRAGGHLPSGGVGARKAAEEALRHGTRAICVISAGFAEVGEPGAETPGTATRSRPGPRRPPVGPNCLGIARSADPGSTRRSFRGVPPRGRSGSPPRAAHSASRCSSGRPARGASASRPSSRSGTRPTSPRTTCSSTGRKTRLGRRPALPRVLRQPVRKFARVARRIARAKPLLAVKAVAPAGGRPGRRISHGRPRGLGNRGAAVFRRAGVTLAGVAGGASRRRGALRERAADPGPPGRRPHERGRARDPVRRRVRGGWPRAARGSGPPRDARSSACWRRKQPSTTRSTCWARRRPRPTSRRYRWCSGPPTASTRSSCSSSRRRRLPAEAVAAAVVRCADVDASGKPILASIVTADFRGPFRRAGSRVAAFPYPESAARALGRAVERRSGSGARPGPRARRSPTCAATRPRRFVADALRGSTDAWLAPRRKRAGCSRRTASPLVGELLADNPDAGGCRGTRSGFPGRRQRRLRPGTTRRPRGWSGPRARPRGRGAGRRGQDRIPGRRPADAPRQCRAPRRHRAGSRVRAARRIGPGRSSPSSSARRDPAPLLPPPRTPTSSRSPHGGRAGARLPGPAPPVGSRRARRAAPLRLSRLADDLPEVAELDLNPVLGLAEGCVAVDARIRVRRPQLATTPKTW